MWVQTGFKATRTVQCNSSLKDKLFLEHVPIPELKCDESRLSISCLLNIPEERRTAVRPHPILILLKIANLLPHIPYYHFTAHTESKVRKKEKERERKEQEIKKNPVRRI